MMLEHRRSPRYSTMAQARIAGILDGENLLKDISITGCCVECTFLTELKSDIQYQLEIEPEGAAKIHNFQLMVEKKWVRSSGYTTEIGFLITASPKGKQFQHYIDYLSYRNSNS